MAIICTCFFVCLRIQLFSFVLYQPVTTISPTKQPQYYFRLLSELWLYHSSFHSVFLVLCLFIFDSKVQNKMLQKLFRNAPICIPQQRAVTTGWVNSFSRIHRRRVELSEIIQLLNVSVGQATRSQNVSMCNRYLKGSSSHHHHRTENF